jgi:hypothetical protein
MSGAVTRSHLSDGRVVGWYGEPGVVVDAESTTLDPPPALVARHGETDFWARWTASECQAKLADVPIVIWLRGHELGSGPGHVETRTEVWPGVTVSVGRAEAPRT